MGVQKDLLYPHAFSGAYRLKCRNPLHLRLCILEFYMSVGVQCNADIRVPHDILQALGIHATLCHLGAKGMSAYMWTCQVWNKKIFYSGWKVSNHSNQILQHLYYLLHDYCCPKHLFTIVSANILVNCFKTPEYGKSD